MSPLSSRQLALIERLRGGKVLIAYLRPGAEDKPHRCYIESPYSDEDGRTVWSLIDRGLLRSEGEGMWTLREAPPSPSHQSPQEKTDV